MDLTGLAKIASKVEQPKKLRLYNISVGGAKIRLEAQNVQVGDVLALNIGFDEHNNESPIIVLAEVRWVSEEGEIGVRFVNLDKFSEARLEKIFNDAGKKQ